MSKIKITTFFEFCRGKAVEYHRDIKENLVQIQVQPDARYNPICHTCKRRVKRIHSYNTRTIRDLNIFGAKTFLRVKYRTLRCKMCGMVVEDMGLMNTYQRITRRFIQYVLQLCKYMSIQEVSRHLELNWKTVKGIHQSNLEEHFGTDEIDCPRLLAVDEVALLKGSKYLTVVINYQTGKVLWVGEGRKYETLKGFFTSLRRDQRESIQAIAMDMWEPYIKATREHCPQAEIVFDQFHVVKAFGKVIDKVRNAEYRKATREDKEVMKRSKYLLLKNKENLRQEEKPRLRSILRLNKDIASMYILKASLKKLYTYKYVKSAQKSLDRWCSLAEESGIKAVRAFAKTIRRHAYGILSHCKFPLHTGRLEGINNKIKVIKRKAYGFHDVRYFSLIIKSSFAFSN